MQQGDYSLAEQELERVASESNSKLLRNRSRYMLAEIAMRRGSTFGALDQLKRLDGGGRSMRSLIHFKTGMLFFKQQDFENALKELAMVENIISDADMDELGMPDNMKYTADFTSGICLKNTGKIENAKNHYKKMIDNNAYFKKYGEIYNEIAACEYESGATEQAEEIYNKVIKEFDKTRAAANALYQLGIIYEKKPGGLSQAFNYYRKAQTMVKECEETILARERLKNLRMIRFLTTPKDSILADSGFTAADSALADTISNLSPSERHFRIAETYLYQLSNGDSAINHYATISLLDTLTDTSSNLSMLKMKAAYAEAWILDNLLGKKEKAEQLYKSILATYPSTETAKAAARAIKLSEEMYLTRDDSLAMAFMKAETLYYVAGSCRAAYDAFMNIGKSWPNDTAWAAKAYLAGGWIAEDCLFDTTLAIRAYTIIDTAYSKTEQALFAKRKLKGRKDNPKVEFAVSKPGSVDPNLQNKIDSIAPGTVVEEKPDEDAWVKLDGVSSDMGGLEGKRSSDEISKVIKPVITALDEIYINLVDEGLKQEGIISIVVQIRSTGEIGKIKIDKGIIDDKILCTQIESLLQQLQFPEAPSDIMVKIRIKFINNAKQTDDL
jgi:tetratricopeptide (TPR) repeat protein